MQEPLGVGLGARCHAYPSVFMLAIVIAPLVCSAVSHQHFVRIPRLSWIDEGDR